MPVTLPHANVIDCVQAHPIPDASVVVENGRIIADQQGF
jgi:hypothetical protein